LAKRHPYRLKSNQYKFLRNTNQKLYLGAIFGEENSIQNNLNVIIINNVK